jgi:hypothetical protein
LEPHRRAWFAFDEAGTGTLYIWVIWKPFGFTHGVWLVNAEAVNPAV